MHISENNEGIAATTLQSCYLKITTLSKTTCAYILSIALKIVEMASSIAREAKRYCDVMQTEVIISKKHPMMYDLRSRCLESPSIPCIKIQKHHIAQDNCSCEPCFIFSILAQGVLIEKYWPLA